MPIDRPVDEGGPTRRSPIGRSTSGLVSRDYRPRTRGPKLITSWPLGPAPGQTEPGDQDWEITTAEFVPIQKNRLTLPYAAPVDYAPTYLNVRGRVSVDSGATLTLRLENCQLSGKPYDVTIDLRNVTNADFQSPFVEFTPERPSEYDRYGEVYAGYELLAKVEGGAGFLDQGTSVQYWSE